DPVHAARQTTSIKTEEMSAELVRAEFDARRDQPIAENREITGRIVGIRRNVAARIAEERGEIVRIALEPPGRPDRIAVVAQQPATLHQRRNTLEMFRATESGWCRRCSRRIHGDHHRNGCCQMETLVHLVPPDRPECRSCGQDYAETGRYCRSSAGDH